jgi:hypothetical protein
MGPQDVQPPPEVRPGQLEYTPLELLSSHGYEEPLIAGGVRCHGGFIGGSYVSPRTLVRDPAIAAWKQRLIDDGEPILYVPREYIPPNYPSYPQAKLLLQEGIRAPITRALTIISIVEGFGARIRDVPTPDFRSEIVEDIGGTAIAHLRGGLFEAHARDEAGWREEGGHKQMWEAARDLGLAKPEIPGDVLMQLMTGGRARGPQQRLFPELSERMELILSVMANVMVIEIFAQDVFTWAKQLLGDPEVSANAAGASAMVSHIESDERPHVEYLRTALSEIRARTLRCDEGKSTIPGRVVIDRLFERQLRGLASARPQEQRTQTREEIHRELAQRPNATELARRFENLDAGWVFPKGENEELGLILRTASAA